MRNLAFWTVVGVALVAANGSVFAASLVPTDQHFKVRGGITVYGPNLRQGCPAIWGGRVDKNGVAKIEAANFGYNGFCQHFRFAGLPWGFKATGVGRVKISGVSFTVPGIVCGPSTINGRLSSGGEITFHAALAGDHCYVGTDGGSVGIGMQTYPPITTVP